MNRMIRWNPVREMSTFRNEFDRMFEDALGLTNSNGTANGRSFWSLALDVTENEDAILVKANMPGVSAEEVDITYADNKLTIKGELAADEAEDGDTYHTRERRYGSFSRTLRLPRNVNGEAIAASFENGVLTITVPKAEELKPRRIAVNAAS